MFLALKNVQMVKITPQVPTAPIINFSSKISLSFHSLTLFGKPYHTPNFEILPMFSTPVGNPAEINL